MPSPENLSTTELEIKIDPLKEAKQPLLTQTNTSLQEIGIESFGDSIENEIRERKKLFDATKPHLKRVDEVDKRYSRKKGLYLIIMLVCQGGMGGLIYLYRRA